tara:strand:- start:4348 stop:5640 length:1293 start_codon:yes stop_codon:yes gene_type:complete
MIKLKLNKYLKISIIGLGYVGLPLAIAFSKHFKVVGFDINQNRIKNLLKGIDETQEVNLTLSKNNNLLFTYNDNQIKDSDIYIITVPTPIFKNKKPNLNNIKNASKTIAKYLSKNNIVIYESTVYPGATEEICIPLLTKYSKLIFNKDFFCGYSPERINPGDKKRTLSNITKITSGSDKMSAQIIKNLYQKIISSKIKSVSSIKVAEAAKVIENTQRDINVAFVNELSRIFDVLNISTREVLDAASTKWNFLDFKPGLVGGHCIGVDPYYLAYKSIKTGYKPNLILSGRNINDFMPKFIVQNLKSIFKNKKKNFKKLDVLIFGYTFKENCPDTRNTQIDNVIKYLYPSANKIHIYDPLAKQLNNDIKEYKKIKKIQKINFNKKFDLIMILVKHKVFKEFDIQSIKKLCKKKSEIFDLKNFYNQDSSIINF